jgi:hypothetical protein
MRARMNDAVHVQVEIVELLAVGVGSRRIDGDHGPIVHGDGVFLQDRGYDLGVFGGEPPEGGGNTHPGMRVRASLRVRLYRWVISNAEKKGGLSSRERVVGRGKAEGGERLKLGASWTFEGENGDSSSKRWAKTTVSRTKTGLMSS